MLSLIHEHEGRAVIIDDSYNIYHQMHFGSHHLTMNEPKMNMHEFTTVDNGTRALHLFRMPKKASRKNSRVVGYDGECYVDYNGFREMDTETWETVFEWDSEGHIGLDESFVTQDPIDQRCGDPDKPWDFLSVQLPWKIWLLANSVYAVMPTPSTSSLTVTTSSLVAARTRSIRSLTLTALSFGAWVAVNPTSNYPSHFLASTPQKYKDTMIHTLLHRS